MGARRPAVTDEARGHEIIGRGPLGLVLLGLVLLGFGLDEVGPDELRPDELRPHEPGLEKLGERPVITIQSGMLVALGFLTAGFIVLLTLPFYRRRAERLAIGALKATLPMTEAEIRADKDRLRAEYAIRIHQLETKVEEAGTQSARQRIELNRRDGVINQLESDLAGLRISLEEHENARRVLEQTITERLPKVEQRLAEARKLLVERDSEIERLTKAATTTAEALEEVRQINIQQKDELHRLNATLTARQARNRDGLADPRFDAEVALRSELEALRARSREQADTIARLQVAAGRDRDGAAFGVPKEDAAVVARQDGEIERLRASLAEAEIALRNVRASTATELSGQQAMQREIETLKSRNRDLDREVARLKSALVAYEKNAVATVGEAAAGESRTALQSKIGALEQSVQSQTVTIQSLRAEIAAANDRLARQAAYYREELRRLGAGTQPVSAEPRQRPVAVPMQQPAPRRQTLAERIAAPRAVDVEAASASPEDRARVSAYLKALAGGGNEAPATPSASGGANGAPPPAATPANGELQRRRSSLIERISGSTKTPAG
ncbi:MAG: hypothetical protein ACK4MF_08530 [Hyphomicrobiaceae bacterium]